MTVFDVKDALYRINTPCKNLVTSLYTLQKISVPGYVNKKNGEKSSDRRGEEGGGGARSNRHERYSAASKVML